MSSFSVRCVFRWEPSPQQQGKFLYEERITLWQAENFDTAVAVAEQEAHRYADENQAEYLDYWQAYELFEEVEAHGVEVFSLLRESDLEPAMYLDAFFDTGLERQSVGTET